MDDAVKILQSELSEAAKCADRQSLMYYVHHLLDVTHAVSAGLGDATYRGLLSEGQDPEAAMQLHRLLPLLERADPNIGTTNRAIRDAAASAVAASRALHGALTQLATMLALADGLERFDH